MTLVFLSISTDMQRFLKRMGGAESTSARRPLWGRVSSRRYFAAAKLLAEAPAYKAESAQKRRMRRAVAIGRRDAGGNLERKGPTITRRP
jgi:hypothetical protein